MLKSASLLAAVGGFCLAAGAASAQPADDTADWSGIYGGVNGGWNWQRDHVDSNLTVNQLTGVNNGAGTVTVPTTSSTQRQRLNQNGFMGGGQLGVAGQAGNLVFGVEGDFDGMTGHGRTGDSYALPATGLTTGSTATVQRLADPNWTATLRGRLGFGMGRALFYGTGGAAWVNTRDRAFYTYTPTVTGAVATANPGTTFGPYANDAGREDTHAGWTVGGGVDFKTSHNMTVGVEYRHTEADYTDNFATSTANSVSDISRMHYRDDAVLGRVNFKFSSLGHMF